MVEDKETLSVADSGSVCDVVQGFCAGQVTRKKPGPKPKPKASKAATKVAAQNKKPVVRGGRGMAGENAQSMQGFHSMQSLFGRQISTEKESFLLYSTNIWHPC